MSIGRDNEGRITGWFVYEDDPVLDELTEAERKQHPELAALADAADREDS